MGEKTILTFKNPDPGSDIILEWDADRAAFVRKDCTITVNWPKLGSVVLQPIKSAIVYLSCHRYELLLVVGCSTGIYTLYKQKTLILVFLAKIRELEKKIISREIHFFSLEELYKELIQLTENSLKKIHSLEIRNLKRELLKLKKELLKIKTVGYSQKSAKGFSQQDLEFRFPKSKAIEFLHKIANFEGQKSERIKKKLAKLIREQQGRIR